MLKLVKPTLAHLEAVKIYRQEFLEAGHTWIDGSAGMTNYSNLEDWFKGIRNNENKATVTKGLVPSSLFLAIREDDNRLVGMIDIRHELNDFLLNNGGHIGYGVRPSERRKGYATTMLSLALEKAKDLGINKALLTCDKGNLPSAKTILANGGILENEIHDEGKMTQRYWVKL